MSDEQNSLRVTPEKWRFRFSQERTSKAGNPYHMGYFSCGSQMKKLMIWDAELGDLRKTVS